MKKIILLMLFCSITSIRATGCAVDMTPYTNSRLFPPETDETYLGPTGIAMPLGRILLVRKDSKYWAVRFTEFWTEKEGKEKFALYQAYQQGDGSGDFSKKNVNSSKGKASFLIPRGIGRLWFHSGNQEVRCGHLRLPWAYKSLVCFFEIGNRPGDHGIELAPTPWTTITEVNVFDPRVKWYRYDEKRERVNIPIDKLWEEKK